MVSGGSEDTDVMLPHTPAMVRVELALALVGFALWVYCLVDVIGRTEDGVRHLPKLAWIVLVLLFPFVGSVAWLLVGRESRTPRRSPYERAAPEFPEYDRPGRAAAVDPAADEAFLRQVRERAERQREAHRLEQRRRREQDGG